MLRKSLWCILLAVPLALGSGGCGAKTEKTGEPEKSKTDKKTEKKQPVAGKTNGTSKKSGKGVASGTGKAARPTAQKPIDTSYISDDFAVAAVLHPAQAYNSPFVKALLAELEKTEKKKADEEIDKAVKQFGVDPRTIEQVVLMIDKEPLLSLIDVFTSDSPPGKKDNPDPKKDFSREKIDKTGKGPRLPGKEKKTSLNDNDGTNGKTQDVTILAQPPGAGGPGPGQPIPSVIVRFNKAPDQEAVLRLVPLALEGLMSQGGPPEEFEPPTKKKSFPPKKEEEKEKEPQGKKEEKLPPTGKEHPPAKPATKQIGGKTAHLFGPIAVVFADDKTLLASTEPLLAKMLAAKDVQSPLVNRLSKIGSENDFVLAVDFTPFTPKLNKFKQSDVPLPLIPVLNLGKKLRTIAIAGGTNGQMLLSGVIELADSEAAEGLAGLIRTLALPMINEKYKELKDDPDVRKLPPEFQPAVTVADKIVESFGVKAEGTEVIFSFERPKEMDELPKLLGPAIQLAREAAMKSTRKNNLHEIGIALHNYHETHAHFPAHDSAGFPEEKLRGLSWRVHLLPFLEHDNLYLYKQFKLNEPWDSAHNKTLISKIPKVYQEPGSEELTDAGKTRLQLLLGKDTTFGPMGKSKQGPAMNLVTDGLTYTIFVVDAGSDKAEIWTKPGGLDLDAAKSVKDVLGNVGEKFLALFGDGHVEEIESSIELQGLRFLVGPHDGLKAEDWMRQWIEKQRKQSGFHKRKIGKSIDAKTIRKTDIP